MFIYCIYGATQKTVYGIEGSTAIDTIAKALQTRGYHSVQTGTERTSPWGKNSSLFVVRGSFTGGTSSDSLLLLAPDESVVNEVMEALKFMYPSAALTYELAHAPQ